VVDVKELVSNSGIESAWGGCRLTLFYKMDYYPVVGYNPSQSSDVDASYMHIQGEALLCNMLGSLYYPEGVLGGRLPI
jgi:predicted N-acetyltransferase YhbS